MKIYTSSLNKCNAAPQSCQSRHLLLLDPQQCTLSWQILLQIHIVFSNITIYTATNQRCSLRASLSLIIALDRNRMAIAPNSSCIASDECIPWISNLHPIENWNNTAQNQKPICMLAHNRTSTTFGSKLQKVTWGKYQIYKMQKKSLHSNTPFAAGQI